MHCHGRDMDQAYKTTILNIRKEASQGFINILAFMPNTEPPIISSHYLDLYYATILNAYKKEKSKFKFFIWFGVTDENLEGCYQVMHKSDYVIGLKVYPLSEKGEAVTTGSIGVKSYQTIIKAMQVANKANKVIAFHCDDPSIPGHTIEAELEYLKMVITASKKVQGVKILIVHISCQKSAEFILEAQKKGVCVAMEISPHHLWFDNEGTHQNQTLDPLFYKCYPPFRTPDDRLFLINLIKSDNKLIMIGSDHAPHTIEEKLKGAGGIPNLLEMVPCITTIAINENISAPRVAELLSFNASNFFGIKIPKEIKKYPLQKRIDNYQYHGDIINPWNGSEFYFPKPA